MYLYQFTDIILIKKKKLRLQSQDCALCRYFFFLLSLSTDYSPGDLVNFYIPKLSTTNGKKLDMYTKFLRRL